MFYSVCHDLLEDGRMCPEKMEVRDRCRSPSPCPFPLPVLRALMSDSVLHDPAPYASLLIFMHDVIILTQNEAIWAPPLYCTRTRPIATVLCLHCTRALPIETVKTACKTPQNAVGFFLINPSILNGFFSKIDECQEEVSVFLPCKFGEV